MCKRKNNHHIISDLQTGANFRLDYYAIPGAIGETVALLAQKYGLVYEKRNLTELEMQIVDYESVASCLGMSLTELMWHPCHLLFDNTGGESKHIVYIHRNFISVQVNTNNSKENGDVLEFTEKVFKEIQPIEKFNVQDLYCKMSFSKLGIGKKDLWSILDKTAFPMMEDSLVINGNYVDTHKVCDFFIDLSRNLSPKDDNTYDVVVSTSALCDGFSYHKATEGKGIKALLKDIMDESIGEVTRCFNGQS